MGPSSRRTACAVFVSVAGVMMSTAAQAEAGDASEAGEAGEAGEAARVRLHLVMPPEMTLLERVRGEDDWKVLCSASCDVDAWPEERAEHVVVGRKRRVGIFVRDVHDGEQSLTVTVPGKSRLVAAMVLGGGGAWLASLGFLVWGLGSLKADTSCHGGPAADVHRCDAEASATARENKREGNTMQIAGGVGIGVGAAMLVAGVVLLATTHLAPSIEERASPARPSPPQAKVRLLPVLAPAEGAPGPARPVRGIGFVVPVVGGTF